MATSSTSSCFLSDFTSQRVRRRAEFSFKQKRQSLNSSLMKFGQTDHFSSSIYRSCRRRTSNKKRRCYRIFRVMGHSICSPAAQPRTGAFFVATSRQKSPRVPEDAKALSNGGSQGDDARLHRPRTVLVKELNAQSTVVRPFKRQRYRVDSFVKSSRRSTA